MGSRDFQTSYGLGRKNRDSHPFSYDTANDLHILKSEFVAPVSDVVECFIASVWATAIHVTLRCP